MGTNDALHMVRPMSLADPYPGYEEAYGFPNEPRSITRES